MVVDSATWRLCLVRHQPKGLLPHLERKTEKVDSTLTLSVLAVSGVLSVALFAIKGLLDQLPAVLNSWHAARRAWLGGRPDLSVPPRPGAADAAASKGECGPSR
ncbi:hypothetical protein SAMN05428945_1582 [Streptomyces sp. 2224.1]|nr:hypothetical protein SAMN05428945_1582 [Streptomyces sp. 2224.1]